jgi:hypothetical protein
MPDLLIELRSEEIPALPLARSGGAARTSNPNVSGARSGGAARTNNPNVSDARSGGAARTVRTGRSMRAFAVELN